MKSNFTKVLLASAAVSTLGLAYAAQTSVQDLEENQVVEWGVSEDGVLAEDMIALGLPFHTPCNFPGDPNEYHFYLYASLYEVNGAAASDDDVDPGFGMVPPTLLKEDVAHELYIVGGEFTTNLFPEVLESGKAYGVTLSALTVVDLNGNETYREDATTWANPSIEFTVGAVPSQALEFDAYLVNGEEQLSLNTHSAVSVEAAEAIAVNFINGLEVRYATYAVDQLGDDVVNLASGALSINTVGYAAFEKALTFISGTQYKVTVKAWDTTDVLDENLNVMEPLLVEEYLINGACAMGVIGEPVFGVERGQFEEDMINLGVPVRFPELQLPFGVVAEDCEITVSASLYGVPQGNEPMPLSMDDDIDPGMGVDGPVALAEGVLFTVSMEGGVATAYLFPEMMEVGNHYAIVLNAVTVIDAEGEIVAELPEDAYYAVDFDVVEAAPVYDFGQAVWNLEGDEETEYFVAEDQAALGVALTFPFAVVPANAVCVADVMLYGIMPNGAEGGIMPLSADDDIDPGFGNVPTVLPLYDEPVKVYASNEGGVIRFNLAAEDLAVGNYYAIEVSKVVALVDDVEVLTVTDLASPVFTVYEVEVPGELEFDAALVAGEEEVALNGHSAVSVESAEALVVKFVNGPMVKYATYAIDMVEEDNLVALASGELSINTVGYAAFENALTFVSGYQYKVTVKAWDTTDVLDEELNVVEPLLAEEYLINGASATGIIGEPVFGVERGEFSEDMINLGVPVHFSEMLLPFGAVAEECEITVSASLYGVPQGNEPMPLSMDDDLDPGMGVDGPVALAEGVLFNANFEGGVATAYLFPEMMEVGNHYAIVLNAVTVINAEGEIVAELPEDAYYAVDFDVIPYVAPIELGFAEFVGIENGVVDVEETVINGVKVAFPAANFGSDDAVVSVMATLYDVTEMGQLAGDDIDNMGVVGPIAVAQDLFVGGLNVESGVYEVALFAEQFVAGRKYVISLETITVEVEDEVILQWDNANEEWASDIFEVISTALEIEPAFIAGEEQIALNSHAAVSVETADALVVNFINGNNVKYATYAIDEYAYDEEAGEMVWYDQLGSGTLSISTVGYVAFDPALTFIAGHQYVLTVKAWDVAEIFDENWNMAQPIAVEEYTFNGAAVAAKLGEPVWAIERGEFQEDMINLGVKVSFPELELPFGVVAEESAVVVYASLSEDGAENDDDIDAGFGLNAQYFFADVEGGVLYAYLFPEQLEVGKTYTISLNGLQFYTLDLEELILDVEADSSVTFTVVAGEDNPTGINAIAAEGNKIMFNLNGQKVNNANGVVVLKGVKALVK